MGSPRSTNDPDNPPSGSDSSWTIQRQLRPSENLASSYPWSSNWRCRPIHVSSEQRTDDQPGRTCPRRWYSTWSPIATIFCSTFNSFIYISISIVPPSIDDSDSSPSQLSVREGVRVSLVCRARGGPSSRVSGKREDGKSYIETDSPSSGLVPSNKRGQPAGYIKLPAVSYLMIRKLISRFFFL